jgi:hypothetical protein
MRKEFRFLLCGICAGLVLGLLTAIAIQRKQLSLQPTVDATATGRREAKARTAADNGVATMSAQAPIGMDRAFASSNDSVTIQIVPSSSLNFSMPLVKALRDLKAAGEPEDVLVNLVVAEFNRQWRDQMKIINQKRRNGEIDNEESQDFFSEREDAIGKTVAELLGQDSFVYWDKQRLLRKGGATGYKFTEAESDALYRIEKEHEDRKLELNGLRNAGEIDPLDFEEENAKSDERYQQLRSKLLTEGRRLHEEGVTVDLRAQIKEQTRQLNLSPQELDALADVAFKNLQASQRMEVSDTNVESRIAKEEAAEAATEHEFMRILGPQRFAELKKMDDNRYQEMKHYQEVWQLTDNDVNYLYEIFVKYDKAIQAHNAQVSTTSQTSTEGNEPNLKQTDDFQKTQQQHLEAELLRFLGEDRLRRFKAAGLIPQQE